MCTTNNNNINHQSTLNNKNNDNTDTNVQSINNNQSSNNSNLFISTALCDRNWLLSDDNNPVITNNQKVNHPEITIKVGNIPVQSLIDTGAAISCIKQQFYLDNKKRFTRHEILPLSNVTITTATGTTSKRIKHIIYIETEFGNLKSHEQYLIVPNLLFDVIIGSDILQAHKAQINMEIKTCTFFSHNPNETCVEQYNNMMNSIRTNNLQEELIHNTNNKCEHKPKCYEITNFATKTENITLHNINYYASDNNDNEPNIGSKQSIENEQSIEQTVEKAGTLSDVQKEQFRQLLYEFSDVFSNKPGLCNKFEYHIELKDDTPFKGHCYPIPACHQEKVTKHLQELLQDNIIERSTSPYINPILVVPKKDNTIRLCLDARMINSKIKNDYDTNRGINELLSKAKSTKFLTTMDLTSSYWQVGLSQQSRPYTAFQYKGRTYQFTRIPFGINISQAALLRAMDAVLGQNNDDFLLLYVDDALLFSDSFKQHLSHLRYFLSKLKESNMTVKLEKSLFFRDQVPFLGYIFTTSGLKPDPKKIEAIKNFPIPKTRKQLKGFIGLVNFYNKFCERFSTTIQPLMKLTSKTQRFTWTEENTKTLNDVKELFISTQLSHPDCTKPFHLQTDCSKLAIGGHLYQLDENGDKKAITFISRLLKPHEVNYTTTEQECLAILHCLERVRHIVLGQHIHIQTDHKALTFLKTCKLLSPRLIRWSLIIQEYNISIEHCPGKQNTVADVLSRTSYETTSDIHNTPDLFIAPMKQNLSPETINIIKNMSRYQSEDPNIAEKRNNTHEVEDLSNLTQPVNKYIICKNLLYKFTKEGYRLILPNAITYHIIKACHEYYLHCGVDKCILILKEYFTFNNMYKKTRKYIKSCDSCQKCKHTTHTLTGEASGIHCTEPRELVSVDFIGPLPRSNFGLQYIFVMVDNFTKYIKLYPLKKATTNAVIKKIFEDYIPNHGKPKKILSDNGTQFRSQNYINNLTENNIQPIFIPIRHPKMNMTERYIQNVKRCLRTLCNKRHRTWSQHLCEIENCLNEIPNLTTGITPNYLHHQISNPRFWHKYLPITPVETNQLVTKVELVRQRIRSKRLKVAEEYNAKHKTTTFNIGDLVLIKSHKESNLLEGVTSKLLELYYGPHEIIEIVGKTVYNVRNTANNNIIGPVHITAMKKYNTPMILAHLRRTQCLQDDDTRKD